MSSRPRLLKKQSSLAILVELERETCESASRPASETDQGREEDAEEIGEYGGEPDGIPAQEGSMPDEDNLRDEKEGGDSEGGDTDAAISSEDETEPLAVSLVSNKKSISASARGDEANVSLPTDEIPPPLRMSRRLMSMKRRGKMLPMADLTEEFEFYAGDVLTVRGEEDDFYVCRVLEDVPESASSFGVAWFNRVADNLYEVSFDDVCYMDSVITRVALSEVEPEKFAILKSHVKQTKKLLKEALAAERGEEVVLEDEATESDDGGKDEEEEEEEPPAKRTRRGSKSAPTPPTKRGKRGQRKGAMTPTKSPVLKRKAGESKPKKEKKKLMPAPSPSLLSRIKLLEKDPTFETSEDVPLMPVKWAIKAVVLNDMEMLKDAIANCEKVFTVHWPRSPEIQLAAVHYALLNENHEALKLLLQEFHGREQEQRERSNEPTISLNRMDTGTYNFYMFGHAVRELYSSRGSREGNNAFLEDKPNFHKKGYDTKSLLEFCFKKGVPLETVKVLMNEMSVLEKSTLHEQEQTGINSVWIAIRHGNRKLAGYFVSKGVDKFGFGFNFLHKEVLLNDDEDLSNFRSQSVKKKPVENKIILPIHAACINPNDDYLRTLLNSVPEHSIPDKDGFKPMHYAAACEGAGPLKVLLGRGADPNDPGPKGITPLMIACKHGRDEIVKELLAIDDQNVDDELEDGEGKKPRVSIDIKNKHTMAAIHYAAKNGHLSTIKLLVAAGANVNLQTGSSRGNVTALMLAAAKGHLDVVKALIELKALPDKKGKWNKTALMYAVKNGHSPIAAYLLRNGVNPFAADTSGNTPIHYAAAYGWLHCLKMLIDVGVHPNAANQWKVTPLAIALMKDHMPCADYLLSLDNVDVNFPDDCGRTLLCQKLRCSALDKKLLEKATFLVEKKGADVNKADIEQWTPLHYLAANSIYERPSWDYTMRYAPLPALMMPMADVSCQLAQLFISAGANPDAVNKEGQTPIMVAILQNNFPLIETLLDCGAKGSVGKNSEGSQVLHIQAEKADELDLSNFYPDAHVDLTGNTEEQRKQMQKHLKSLVMRASNDMMEKLIAGGAEINCVRSDGLTPLMLALSMANMDQFSMLLDHDADPFMGLDKTGRNILHLLASRCAAHDLRTFMKIILKKTNPDNLQQMANLVDNNGFTPLLQACETIASSPPNEENNEFVKGFLKTLIDKFGCSVKARVGKVKKGLNVSLRNPPTFCLSREKGKEVDISLIHQKQKMWNDGDEDGDNSKNEQENISSEVMDSAEDYGVTGLFTCLHFLVYERWNLYPFLELVLEYVKGIKSILNSFDCHGRTPLHLAVKWGNTKAAKLLIITGADVNVPSLNEKDDALATPLILASRPSSVRLVTLKDLLEANADPNITDSTGRTALSWAVTSPSDSNSTPLKLCKALLEAGANVNSADAKKRMPLHYAVNATTGDFETLTEVEDLLIKYGANTTALDMYNRIPLHYSFVKMRGRHNDYVMIDPISVAGLLCEAMAEQGKDLKAELNHKDNFGQTSLHRAALRGATICALNLIQKGASLEIKDNDGNTPLSLALREGHDGCAMMFMQSNAPASCQVIKPLTPDDWKKYEKEKKETLWVWKNVVDLSEPKPDVRAAFRVVIDNNWQGIAYLMLEVSGLDFIEAITATLESNKLDLAWALLRKQRKDSAFQGVDKKGRNLLHLLAIHCAKLWTQVVEEIANHLVLRGVSAGAIDSQGATALHYAACNHNLAFCRFLWEHSPSSVDVADNDGVTPFAAIFSNAERGIITLVEFFVSPSACHVKNLDVCYNVRSNDENSSQDSTTPLIEAAVSNNEKVVTLMLKHGASVNFPKHDGRTPLMEAVRDNMMDMVKVLTYATDDRTVWETKETTLVDLTLRDNDGKSVIHHCVQNREYGSAENVDLLNFLASFEAPLALKDSEGHTPLYYAKQQESGVMAKALAALLGETEANEDTEEPMEFDSGFKSATVDDDYWQDLGTDPAADSEKILQEAREQDIPDDDEVKVTVDSAFRMEGGGEVFVDPGIGVPYDILMSKVDVKYGMFGLNNFYKMQIVHHKAKDLWVLFNRWGRVGDSGQHQRTPYNDPDTAAAEFKKIFKSKTGNEWINKDNFFKLPKKYALVLPERNPENKRKQMREVLKPFELTKCPPSHLSEEMQSFMKAITNFGVLSSAMSSYNFRLDQDYMPFGRLSKETIEQARGILKEIKAIVATIDRRNLEGTEGKFEKIAELSNTYYMLMPVAHYTYERIPPLNEADTIERHMDALYKLTELADASKILLGAQHRSKEVNPLDYVYKSLGCQLELLDPNSEECQLILEYIYNSKGTRPVQVGAIFRVSRAGEAERFRNCGVPGNHRLLWHGTKAANMMGILQQGLRIAPPDASRSGWTLGKGIYSSDSLEKGINYTDYGSGSNGFVLLCEVALGRVKELTYHAYQEGTPEGFDSVLVVSKVIPEPSEDVTTPYGAVVPAGVRVRQSGLEERLGVRYIGNNYSEYVVYKESQVLIRYVVQLTRTWR